MFDPLSDPSASAWSSQPSASQTAQPPQRQNPALVAADLDTPPTSPRHRPRLPLPPNPSGPPGREPQIYGEPGQGLITPPVNIEGAGAGAVENAKQHEADRKSSYLRVRVTALDRNRRDIIIRMDAQTNLPNFNGNSYRNISRTYVEFQNFFSQITYSNPQTIVPALPLPQTSAPTDEEDDRIIKIMLQRWLTRICDDPVLLKDDELRSFIESEFGYSAQPRPRRKANTGFSLFRHAPPDEDEHLQQARFELTKLETLFTEAARAVDKLSRARRAMSQSQIEMGNKLISVATTEVHQPLSLAVRKYGRSVHVAGDIVNAEAMAESTILGDTLGYQGMNARMAKETLQQRSLALEEYQIAVKSAISKRRNIERLRASSNIRPDRVDEALEELEEANKYEQVLARRVDGISNNLHRALQVHNKHVDTDLSAAFIEHARMAIMYERQMLKELEALKPDFANANGVHIVTAPKRPVQAPTIPMPNTLPPSQSMPPQQQRQSQQPMGPPPVQNWQPPVNYQISRGVPPPITVSALAGQPVSPASSVPSVIASPLTPASQVGQRYQNSIPPSSPGAGGSPPHPAQRQEVSQYTTSPLYDSSRPASSPIVHPQPHAPGGVFRQRHPQQQYQQQQQQHYPEGPAQPYPQAGVTQSMFITPPSHIQPPASADPLSAQSGAPTIGRPGSASPAIGYHPQGYGQGQMGVDPLSQSMRVQPPRRPRLDAREAASKLANLL